MRIKPRPEKAPEKRTKSQVVGGWFKEESFYRDITTRSLSAGLVALVAYLSAVGLGYIGAPSRPALFAIGLSVANFTLYGLCIYLTNRGRKKLAVACLILAGGLIAAWVIVIRSNKIGHLQSNDGWGWFAILLPNLAAIYLFFATRKAASEKR